MKRYKQVHVKLYLNSEGELESETSGCGCCSSSFIVDKKEALEEIREAIKDLLEIRRELLNER